MAAFILRAHGARPSFCQLPRAAVCRIGPAVVTAWLAAAVWLGAACGLADDYPEKQKPPEELLALLVGRIVPQQQPARPPYLPARYDLGLRSDLPREAEGAPVDADDPFEEPADSQPRAEQSGATIAVEMAAAAQRRQRRIEALWTHLKRYPPKQPTAEQTADLALLRYAFDECELAEARSAARRAGPDARLRLARLLLAECRFDDALYELAALAGLLQKTAAKGEKKGESDPSGEDTRIAQQALALLVAHRAQREALACRVDLLPLQFDLAGCLERLQADARTKALIESLDHTVAVRVSADSYIVEHFPEDSEIVSLSDDPSDGEVIDPVGCVPLGGGWPRFYEADRWYLADVNRELVLYQEPGWNAGDATTVKLYSIFGGPLRFRLYHFADKRSWEQIDAEGLAGRNPRREWTKAFRPLSENNVRVPEEQAVRIEGLDEGWYLLTVQARYAPMIGACKFCVNNVALYLHAGRNRGLAVAVDRRHGRPVANLPLRLRIDGTPDMACMLRQFTPSDHGIFRLGLLGWSLADATPEADKVLDEFGHRRRQEVESRPAAAALSAEDHLRRAESYRRGIEAGKRYPDFHQGRRLKTGPDGVVSFPLDLGRTDYHYTLGVERSGDSESVTGLSRVKVSYHEPEPRRDRMKAVVWLAQPIHRPGETVRFKGIIRRFNGRRVADHGPNDADAVEVRVVNRDGILWKETCEISAAGTFAGKFHIPPDVSLGPCFFYVQGVRAAPNCPLSVAEFRLPTYEVVLHCPKRAHAGGEELCGAAEVRYFTGKPAVGAEVEAVIEAEGLEPVAEIVLSDESGRAEFRLPLPLLEESRRLPLRVTVMDAAGQTYTESSEIDCRAGAFDVNVGVRHAACEQDGPFAGAFCRGEPIVVRVQARRWTGAPISGATVAVEGCRQSATSDENGVATLRLKAAARGKRQSLAVTAIADGEVVRAASESIRLLPHPKPEPEPATVAKDAPPAESSSRPRPAPPPLALESLASPEVIDAGEPLEFGVRVAGSVGQDATLVVIAENDRLLHAETRRVRSGEHRFMIATQRDWAPSVRLTAVLLDGRHERRSGRDVFLRPTERFLTLTIATDKQQYAPGETCTAMVTALDFRGRPVSRAEISLGVVDEALYEVLEDPTPDLREFFYRYRLPLLCAHKYDTAPPQSQSLSYWLGPRYAWGYFTHEPLHSTRRRLLARYGCAAGSERYRAPRVRKRFETAAHWVADLLTDGEGTARTSFRLPDSLTRWRFTARGVTPDTRVGQLRVERRTFLPLQVELAVPRVVREGDRIALPLVLHNNTDQSRRVQVRARVGSGKELPFGSVRLEPNADRVLTIPFEARGTSPIKLIASVRDKHSGEGDAIEKTIAPRPKGFAFVRTFSGPLDETRTLQVDPGVEFPPKGLKLAVRREPGLAGVIQSAVGELIDYPYGCVEQTMSRFMPALLAGRALRDAGIEDPAAKRLPEVVSRGLAKLAGYQHADGGWGWWQHDRTNDFMTAYVLEGLALCRRSGHAVPQRMLEAGHLYLARRLAENRLEGRRPHSVGSATLPVFAAHALAMLCENDPVRYQQAILETAGVLERIERQGGALSAIDEVLLADAWRLLGRPDRAAAMLPRLRSRFSAGRGDRRQTIYAAQVIALGAALEPEEEHWTRLAGQLAAARQGAGWGDTLRTAYAVRALAAVVRTPRPGAVPVAVLRDNKRLGLLPRIKGRGFELMLYEPCRITLSPKHCGCDDFYHARLQGHLAQWLPNPPEPEVILRLGVVRLLPEREAVDQDRAGRVTVQRGVTLQFVVEVELERQIEHARLTVPRPCGFELMRTAKASDGVAATEEHDDAWHFFIERWDGGIHKLDFLVRAELCGTVTTPPPELAPMYDDSRWTAVFAPKTWRMETPQ